jgi:quinol monooxygenase YgiN
MTEPVGLVTYLDFGPSFAGAASDGLRAWAARVRADDAASEATLLREVGRPERFALIETWADQARLDAHRSANASLAPAAAAGLCAPPDERIGEPFSLGAETQTRHPALYVLVHVDVVPFNLEAVGVWLKAEAEASRASPGALRYEVWRQAGRPNHFTVIEGWADADAYARHVESEPTRAFRANLTTVKGALYDARLYQSVD